ncbi:MAG TPA: hypothetical protein VFQ39_16955, partial [Longimicrobium sp.]|nr:hypothetical protein [Longimicrobium sp.]
VEVSVERAFGRACETCTTAFFRWAPATKGVRAIAGWPEARFPLRVAFDREWSGETISARDSTRFWQAVESLEEAFGEDLFRPAAYADAVPREDGANEDVILVWIDPELRDFTGYGSAVSSAGDVTYGDLRLRRGALRDEVSAGLVMHELLHTLGFGHTCAWRSVLADARRCPYLRAEEPTPEDVAYVQLAARVREMERAARGRVGMQAALAGEHFLRAGAVEAGAPLADSPR